MKKISSYLFIFAILYFALGFVNILFAWAGLICMTIPIILLFKNGKKTWCQKYCPRGKLFAKCGKCTSKISKSTPKSFIKGNVKWFVLIFFIASFSFIIISTVMVAMGKSPALNYLRFLLVIPLKFELPQLIKFANVQDWLYHFEYSLYSLMMTTTTLGLILALVYKPRTWCVICPIATVSEAYIKSKKN